MKRFIKDAWLVINSWFHAFALKRIEAEGVCLESLFESNQGATSAMKPSLAREKKSRQCAERTPSSAFSLLGSSRSLPTIGVL